MTPSPSVARLKTRELESILEFVSLPTAPFRESAPKAFAQAFLEKNSVPFFEDAAGNIVVGVDSKKNLERLALKKSKTPLVLAIAHLDHPGFHGVRWSKDSAHHLEGVWHGGGPVAETVGRDVWLTDSAGERFSGKVVDAQIASHGKAIETLRVQTDADGVAKELFGGFSFRDAAWIEGDLLYTKSADDLIGAYAILRTAAKLHARKNRATSPAWIGLLTRAEEVGCVGCEAHLNAFAWKKWTDAKRRPLYALSIETSRTLPGAEIGKGPIVRLGDRKTPFTPDAIQLLQAIATRKLPGRHQRRIMDGGACEGSTALTHGLQVMALSVPLGNYHNQTLEGGPESGVPLSPAPEFVSIQDLMGLFTLCEALTDPKQFEHDAWKAARKDAAKRLKSYLPLLR